MSVIAERTHAKPVVLAGAGALVRGFHFDPNEMDDKARDFVFRSVYPVGLEAFVQNPSTGMEKDIADHLFGTENLLVLRSDGYTRFGGTGIGRPRPIGFCVWNTYETKIGNALYVSGVAVNPSWQGKGLGRAMQQYALIHEAEKAEVKYAFMSTQNAVEKNSFDRAMGSESYPRRDGSVCSEAVVFAAARNLLDRFEPLSMRLWRHYGGASLYGIMPENRDAGYEQLFSKLDREQGDAYLCVSRV